MQFGIDTAQQQLTWPQLRDRVRYVEDLGFDGAWLFDHFKVMYGDPLGPCLEAWTLLAALAATTSRIRLGTMVTGMTYRHPSMLAMEAVTIDHVSDGRLDIAVGAGWFEEEHHEFGFDFPEVRARAERLEEGVQVMRLLMTRDGVAFAGKHVTLKNATFRPRPVQQPHPPIWIGVHGERLMLPIAARHADVWHGWADPAAYRRKSELIDRYAEDSGRDPSTIRRATSISLEQPDDDIRRAVAAYAEIGVDYIYAGWPGTGEQRVEEYATHIVPEFR